MADPGGLFVFGFGYAARALAKILIPRGWSLSASARDSADGARLKAVGVTPVELGERDHLAAVLAEMRALLVTAAPDEQGCPGLRALAPALAQADRLPDWTGYLSTTGVYGDRRGGWVTETSRLAAQTPQGARRVAAERDWLQLGRGMGLNVAIFRLPGIYGPGRSVLDRLRRGDGRNIAAPGQVFSRIHIDDLATGLAASMDRPRAAGVYNLCDDEPCPNPLVVAFGAQLLGLTPPPEVPLADAGLPSSAQRFYIESKRVSNALAKAELGWRPRYPTYREGLRAIIAAEGP